MTHRFLRRGKIKTIDKGEMADWPILQAADMLAYGEWRSLRAGRLEIYNALHRRSSRYQPRLIDCTHDDIQRVVEAADSFKAAQNAFWDAKRKSAHTVQQCSHEAQNA